MILKVILKTNYNSSQKQPSPTSALARVAFPDPVSVHGYKIQIRLLFRLQPQKRNTLHFMIISDN